VVVAELEDGCLGADPGSKEELTQGFAGARALRSGGSTTAQRFCSGGKARRGGGVVVAAAGWGFGFQGVRPGEFKGGAGFLGVRAP